MSLGDYTAKKPSDSQYLGEGWHPVTVTTYEVGVLPNEKRTPKVEFSVEDSQGLMSKVTFFLTEAALGILASFAKTCGLMEEECHNYDPLRPESHRALKGRKLLVHVFLEKGRDGIPKYSKVDDWEPFGTDMSKLNTPSNTPNFTPEVERQNDPTPPF